MFSITNKKTKFVQKTPECKKCGGYINICDYHEEFDAKYRKTYSTLKIIDRIVMKHVCMCRVSNST